MYSEIVKLVDDKQQAKALQYLREHPDIFLSKSSLLTELIKHNIDAEIIYSINNIVEEHARNKRFSADHLARLKYNIFEQFTTLSEGMTPIQQALYQDRLDLVQALIDVSSDPNILSLNIGGGGKHAIEATFKSYLDNKISIETLMDNIEYLITNSPDGNEILFALRDPRSPLEPVRLNLANYMPEFGVLIERYPQLIKVLTRRIQKGQFFPNNIPDRSVINRKIIKRYLWEREQQMLEDTFEYLGPEEEEELNLPRLVMSFLPLEHLINPRR